MGGPYPYNINATNVNTSASQTVASNTACYYTPLTINSNDTSVTYYTNEYIGPPPKKPETRKQIKLRQASAFKQFYGKPTYQPIQKKTRSADHAEKHKRPMKYKNINENLIL